MEKLVALQTTNPQARIHSRSLFPPPRRRSHLDSASYRTLVRIFSICLDESLNASQESREEPTPVSPAAASQVLDRSSAGKDDRNDDGVFPVVGRGVSESFVCASLRFGAVSESNIRLEERLETGKGGNGETANSMLPEGLPRQFVDDKDEASPVPCAAASQAPDHSSAGEDSIFDRNDDGILSMIGRGGRESFVGGSPRFNAVLESDFRLEEKLEIGQGGNDETVNSTLPEVSKRQFRGDKNEASYKSEVVGIQHVEGGHETDVGLKEGPITGSKLEISPKENVCIDEVSQSPIHGIIDVSTLVQVQEEHGSAEGLPVEVAGSVFEVDIGPCLDSENEIADQVANSEQRNNHEVAVEQINETPSEALTDEVDTLIMCSSSNELLHDTLNADNNGCIKLSAPDLSLNELLKLKPQEMSNPTNELTVEHQHKFLDSSLNSLVSNGLDKNLLNALMNSDSDEEVEEGQIPGDFWNLDESELMVHQSAPLDGQKTEKGSSYTEVINNARHEYSLMPSGTDCSSENILLREINLPKNYRLGETGGKDGDGHLSLDVRQGNTERENICSNAPKVNVELRVDDLHASISREESPNKASIDEAGKVKTKQKRGALTEERKAKKKKAKRRKRAEKEREQGVKRLKLQPVIKPPVVKICNYYLKGRCQQGDQCKFSHDATPITKSQPCKYFATDSCLKGDDCQFDHELSKYPCHNFQSKGMCHRGDRCKFSHKILKSEGLTSAPVGSNLVSPLTAEKLRVGKQQCLNKKPSNAKTPEKSMTSSTGLLLLKQLEGNMLKTVNESMKIPNGLCFISFGNGPSDGIKKPVDTMLPEKHGCNEQKPEKSFTDQQKNTACFSEKSLPNLQTGFNVSFPSTKITAGDYLKNTSSSSGTATMPISKSLQNEVSEASKILEEFLFCGTG